MYRYGWTLALLASIAQPASAQDAQTSMDWMPWNRPGYVAPSYRAPHVDEDQTPPSEIDLAPAVLEGGPRPSISPIQPEQVDFISTYAPSTIVIDTAGRRLYLVRSPTTALVYPISVGREGFTWTGTEVITRIADWPDWHPPAEMRERDRRLPEKMTGGVRNPLGAKAMYLGSTLYRIHGTDSERTIGQATSSGCFRMTNGHVVDLASRVGVGSRVVVVNELSPGMVEGPTRKMTPRWSVGARD